ncbi:MAG: hypothetical protein NZM02_02940 [Patescibacteria group bacterium]|nr:hypothetical protein [Patescibacteria group bacterium]
MSENPFLKGVIYTVREKNPPVQTIPSFMIRKDHGKIAWEDFWTSLTNEAEAVSGQGDVLVTFCASPHTNETITDNGENKPAPAHFLVWAKNYQEGKTPGVASLDDTMIKEVEGGIVSAVNRLSKNEEKPVIYSLQGYTDENNLVFSPGPQSNPFFHTHVVLPSINGENKEDISFKEKLKYYGFFNAEIFQLFEIVVQKFLQEKPISVERTDNDFYLRLRLQEQQPSLSSYLKALRDLGGKLESFYQGLLDYYIKAVISGKRIFKENELPDLIKELKKSLQEKGVDEDFGDDFYQRVLEIMSFIRPSNRLLASLIVKEKDPARKKILRGFLKRNRHRRERFKDARFKERLKTAFKLNDEEADGFFEFVSDLFLNVKGKNPIYSFSQRFPWVFLIDDYDFQNSQLNLKNGVKIRPMFLTAGGNTAERITGTIIRR